MSTHSRQEGAGISEFWEDEVPKKSEISSIIEDKRFWLTVDLLERGPGPHQLNNLLKMINATKVEMENFFLLLEKLDYKIQSKPDGADMLIWAKSPLNSRLGLHLREWLAIQSHLVKSLGEIESSYCDILQEYVGDTLQNANDYLNVGKLGINTLEQKGMISQVEKIIKNKGVVNVEMKNSNKLNMYFHRLVILESNLCVIGEDLGDRCLVFFPLSDIAHFESMEKGGYRANFSGLEVDDFICSVRAVSGNESRLILKIKNGLDFEIVPPYQFLGNPFVTTNLNGDRIWAASVENSPGLIDWLLQLGPDVEVLDPEEIRAELSKLIEFKSKQKKVA